MSWITLKLRSSISRLLVSLVYLKVPRRTHELAPALQPRMDDFTALPGFPLWPRDLPLPSPDISQQHKREHLCHRHILQPHHLQRRAGHQPSDPAKGIPALLQLKTGSITDPEAGLFFEIKVLIYAGDPSPQCPKCCHITRGKWAATGRTARSARCPLAADCRTQAPFSPGRKRRDLQSLDRSAEPSEVNNEG